MTIKTLNKTDDKQLFSALLSMSLTVSLTGRIENLLQLAHVADTHSSKNIENTHPEEKNSPSDFKTKCIHT